MAPRESEDNAYAKLYGDKQRALWYIMVFSVVVNSEWSFVQRVTRLETKKQEVVKMNEI